MTFSDRAIEAAARAMMQHPDMMTWSIALELSEAALTSALAVDGLALVQTPPSECQIESGSRAMCKADGLDPDADWRDNGTITFDVAIEEGKEQRWRIYARRARDCYLAMLTAASDGEVG